MSQTHHGLLAHQVKQIQNVVLVLIIAITFWLGFTSSSFLLVAQAILSTSFFVQKSLDTRIKKSSTLNQNFWDFFWLIGSSVLITIFATLNLVELQNPLAKSVPGAIILIAFSSLVAQIILIIGVEKSPLKMEFFRDNSSWIFVLIAGLIMQFAGFNLIDPIFAIATLMYLAITTLQKLYKQDTHEPINQLSEDVKYQLDQEVIDDLLLITKLEKLDNFNVIKVEDDYLVSGNLVVSNSCNQEDIFEIKTKAKKVLQKSGFENSVLEIVYLAEFKNRD